MTQLKSISNKRTITGNISYNPVSLLVSITMLYGSTFILLNKSCYIVAPIQLIIVAVFVLPHAKSLPNSHPLNYLEINFVKLLDRLYFGLQIILPFSP